MTSLVRVDESFEFGVPVDLLSELHDELQGLVVESIVVNGLGDGIDESVFVLLEVTGGLGVHGRPALRTEPGFVPERGLALRADLQRGATDGDVFFGFEAVVGAESVHHLLVIGLVVAFEDVGVGSDTDHEFDSVVGDSFITHARNSSVTEVVGLDALGIDSSRLRDFLQAIVGLRVAHRVAGFPRDHMPVFVGALPALAGAEERRVGIVSTGMILEPGSDVGAGPEKRPGAARSLESLCVVVEPDGGFSRPDVDVVEDDAQRRSDSLAGDAQECDQCGVPRIRARFEESIDFLTVQDLLGSNRWSLRGADDDFFGPVTVEFVTEEETSCLTVLADASITQSLFGDARMRAVVKGFQQVEDFGVVFEFDEWFVCSFTHQTGATESPDECGVSDVLTVSPADEGITVFAGVELLDLFDLGLQAAREVVDVFDAHRSDKDRGGEFIKLSSQLLHEIWRRLCRILRGDLTRKQLLTSSFSPASACPNSIANGGVSP